MPGRLLIGLMIVVGLLLLIAMGLALWAAPDPVAVLARWVCSAAYGWVVARAGILLTWAAPVDGKRL